MRDDGVQDLEETDPLMIEVPHHKSTRGRIKGVYQGNQKAVVETVARPWGPPLRLEAQAWGWRPPVLRPRTRR